MFTIQDGALQQAFQLKPVIEFRQRIERRTNRDFSNAANDDRTDVLTRARVGVEGSYGKRLRAVLQYQYSHDWILKSGSKATDEASDLALAYVQVSDRSGNWTVGRQRLSLGTERLVGSGEWLNVPRTMNGFRFQGRGLDAFAFKLDVGQPKPTDARVFGAAYSWSKGQSAFIFKHDTVNGRSVDIGTLSHSFNHKVGSWALDGEVAVQFGKNRGLDQRGWALHASVTKALAPQTKGYAELNSASGGRNSDTVFTFDNLYPTNHKFYGSMDLQGWKNMNELVAGLSHQVGHRLNLSMHAHSFTLRDPSDAWYGAGGAPNKGVNGDFVDPLGLSGRDVGWELDIEAMFRPSPTLSVSAGVGIFTPGSFVRRLNGGVADRQTWLFVSASAKF